VLRCSEEALRAPERYSSLVEDCRQWALGLTPTVRGLTPADIERARQEMRAKASVSRPHCFL
jgi:hypothetical protein